MVPSCNKISGKQSFLRPMKCEDITDWTSWFNDLDVLKYSVHRAHPTTQKKQQRFFEENNKDPKKVQFSICTKNDILVGVVSITFKTSDFKEGDISIIIGKKDYWGKGIATDAIHTIVKYANQYHHTTLFRAGCDARNLGSEKSFLKNGFKKLETLSNTIKYPDENKSYDLVQLILKV